VLPALFLDVDGVLSARKSPWEGVRRSTVTLPHYNVPWALNISPKLGERLLELPVEIHWLTTWRHEANTVVAPLAGLPGDLPVIEWEFGETDFASIEGKSRAVRAWCAEHPGKPYVWVDDEHCEHPERFEGTVRDLTKEARLLIVGPNETVGLTPAHLGLIEAWALANAVPSGHGSPTPG